MDAELLGAWQEAAADLGIEVRVHGDAVVVEDFGSRNGMLCSVPTNRDGERALRREAERCGMGWSVLTRTYARYDRMVYVDTLNDWGWTGDGPPPPWYTGDPWTE
jgi:hypothetical protein